MKTSNISWTDYSGQDLNFVSGCTPVSEGCEHCYARAIYKRFGRDFDTVRRHEDRLQRIHKGRGTYSPKRGMPHKPMCFVCDTGDLFHDAVPDWFVLDALTVMAMRDGIVWQLLTKRPARMRTLVREWTHGVRGTIPAWVANEPFPDNIWLGVTAENQARADERIPVLLDTPAAVRFISVEPMLEAVDLSGHMPEWDHRPEHEYWRAAFSDTDGKKILIRHGIDWVICGAESGPNRRPFNAAWATNLYEQCKEAGVPFFGKQDSGLRPGTPLLINGQEIKRWPE